MNLMTTYDPWVSNTIAHQVAVQPPSAADALRLLSSGCRSSSWKTSDRWALPGTRTRPFAPFAWRSIAKLRFFFCDLGVVLKHGVPSCNCWYRCGIPTISRSFSMGHQSDTRGFPHLHYPRVLLKCCGILLILPKRIAMNCLKIQHTQWLYNPIECADMKHVHIVDPLRTILKCIRLRSCGRSVQIFIENRWQK